MANYSILIDEIRDTIYSNDNEEITGDALQEVLLDCVDSLGKGFQYVGLAETTTDPHTPDEKVYYIAKGAGTYTHFDNIVVNAGELALLVYDDGSWSKHAIAVGGGGGAETIYEIDYVITFSRSKERWYTEEEAAEIGLTAEVIAELETKDSFLLKMRTGTRPIVLRTASCTKRGPGLDFMATTTDENDQMVYVMMRFTEHNGIYIKNTAYDISSLKKGED